MPRGDMTGPLGEGSYTGRRGGKGSPRERFGPGWRAFMSGGSGGMGKMKWGFGRGMGRGNLAPRWRGFFGKW